MTAIAGIVEDGKIWLGGDAAGTGGYRSQLRADPKVFVKGEFAFGYTGSFRMGQLIEYEFSAPVPREGEAGMAYMVRRFVPAIKSTFAAGGFHDGENGRVFYGGFLVGYRGQLYEVHGDYQVARITQSYMACGSGHDLALGSLHSTEQFQLKPRERLEMALSAAAEFNAAVRGPFSIVSV